MKILVTGGAGFIGSNVVDIFISNGHEVLVIDDLSTGKRENLNPKAKFFECDIRDTLAREIILKERPDIIDHHAAQMSVPASVEDPIFDADVNIKGLINILEAAKDARVKKIIFISSGGAIYGEATKYPTSESYRPQPMSPYAITKYSAELYLAFYNAQYGLDYTVLRYANVYGPRQIPHGEAAVVAIFMNNLLSGKPSNLFHFNDEPRGMTRDYCFVGDIARANLLALTLGSNTAFNIGTGKGTHTGELFSTIYNAASSASPALDTSLGIPVPGPARDGDIKRSCLTVDLAKQELDWKADITLEEGIKRTLQWKMER